MCHLPQGSAPVRSVGVVRAASAVAPRAEISYVMVKPDGVQRGLVGDIISRFERKGFKLVGLKLYQTPRDVAEEHYKDLKEKPFYGKLVEYIVSGPVVAMVRRLPFNCRTCSQPLPHPACSPPIQAIAATVLHLCARCLQQIV